jgi:hypothetical protein
MKCKEDKEMKCENINMENLREAKPSIGNTRVELTTSSRQSKKSFLEKQSRE